VVPAPEARSFSSPPTAEPAIAATYGGDEAGLICGYLFNTLGSGHAQELNSRQAADWLARQSALPDPAVAADQSSPAYLWLHFNLSHAQAVKWLQRHVDLAEDFFDALAESQPSTRIERTDDALVAVINDVHFDFGFESGDIATLWISVGPGLVVTARNQPLRSVDTLRTAVREGESPPSPTALLEHLLRAQADALVKIVRGVTARVDAVEDELLRGRLGGQQALQAHQQPAALFRLLQRPPGWMAADDIDELRGATEEFSVVLRDMQALQERIKLLQEEIAANVNEDNNRSLFVLTVVTVLALPINILAGLFGMNVGGIPLAENGHGFWIVVAIVLSFTAIAAWLAFRNKR